MKERFRTITSAYYRGAAGILIVYDITNRASFDNVRTWVGECRRYGSEDCRLMIVGNKIDLGAERQVSTQEGLDLAREFDAWFYETSAKESTNVADVFFTLARSVRDKSSPPPEIRFIESEACFPRKQFLMERIEMIHDTVVHVGFAEGQQVSFRCFRSFLDACRMMKSPHVDRMGQVNEFRVELDVDAVHLTEGRFLEILLGLVPVESLCGNIPQFLDVCEILRGLQMTRLLWWICEDLVKGDHGIELTFPIFQMAFDRFEEPVDPESPMDIRFRSVVAHAAFVALQKKKSDLMEAGDSRLTWLMRNLLAMRLHGDELHPVVQHAQLELVDVDCLSPIRLLLEHYKSFGRRLSPNVELQSKIDGGSVRMHIELLLLQHEFIRLMLRSDWAEKLTYETSRVIGLESLPTSSIELLATFAYVGELPESEEQVPMDTVLQLLRHSDQSPGDEELTQFCIEILSEMKTSDAAFLEELQGAGPVFEDLASKDAVLQAWASQGVHTMDFLVAKVAEAIERARE